MALLDKRALLRGVLNGIFWHRKMCRGQDLRLPIYASAIFNLAKRSDRCIPN